MNNGLIAICDTDSDYANSLAAYFRIKGSIALEISVFTEYETFSQYANEHKIDILVIQENFLDSVTNFSHNNLFLLCENELREDFDNPHKIYKYNSADEILRIIMANYDASEQISVLSLHRYKKSKLIGITSPIGRCGKTSLGLSLGLKLSQNHSCLFITFDECSPLRISLLKKELKHSSLADILYYFLQSMDISDNRLLSSLQTFQGMDYIPPSDQSGTYSELSSEDILSFILGISGLGRYDYIIIDWGIFSFDYTLIKSCDYLLLPSLENDKYSSEKTSCFYDILNNQYKDDTKNIKQLVLPYISYSNTPSEYLYLLTSQALGSFSANLIQELNL